METDAGRNITRAARTWRKLQYAACGYVSFIPSASFKVGDRYADAFAVRMEQLAITHVDGYVVDFAVPVRIGENQVTSLEIASGYKSACCRLVFR